MSEETTHIPKRGKIWETEKLKLAEYNPRKISPEAFNHLRESIKEFGFVEPIVVNTHPDRYGVVVGGHQRLKVADAEGMKEVPAVEVYLDIEKEKELNIRLNKNTGEFDIDKLLEGFQTDMLLAVGFTNEELHLDEDDFEEQVNKKGTGEATYPLVPEFSERYSYVIIMSTNEVDEAWMKEFFVLGKQKCYKTSRVSMGHAVLTTDLQAKIEKLKKGKKK